MASWWCSSPPLPLHLRTAELTPAAVTHTDMWKSVVNSINLSEQQKLNIVQWKQLFMQKVCGL